MREWIEGFVELTNSDKNHLGQSLPKGVVRVYKADQSGAKQFVGEDKIEHTPRDVRERLGDRAQKPQRHRGRSGSLRVGWGGLDGDFVEPAG